MMNDPAQEPDSFEWNSSARGGYLWAGGTLAELVPGVMTPSTWSLMQIWDANIPRDPALAGLDVPLLGNIGGRLYANLTPFVTLAVRQGMKPSQALRHLEGTWGHMPAGLEPAGLSMSRATLIEQVSFRRASLERLLLGSFRQDRQRAHEQGEITAFAAEVPDWCARLHRRIPGADEARLKRYWREDIQPQFERACFLAAITVSDDAYRLARTLTNLLGAEPAHTLLAGLDGTGDVASLEPLVGLARILDRSLTHDEYRELYGHRSPDEFELSVPRPAEDPLWLQAQLSWLDRFPVDIDKMLLDQRARSAAVWAQFQEVYRRKAGLAKRSFRTIAEVTRLHALARSEQARIVGVIRALILRAGELTGLGESAFFLTLDELCAVLGGDERSTAHIPARRALYSRYSALPRYPAVIDGAFDPFAWAADSQHAAERAGDTAVFTGFPGAAGVVEGLVHRLDHPDAGAQLQPGEILVTATTNPGWLLPVVQAAAIVTELGAPLSHTAIASHELGVPAVIGCGSAATGLNTGDRVRVDGAHGTVTRLDPA